jgi:BirA family biotin operon repressor/biotin-[acetyl-CoA-carboxylase] ligase
VLVDGKKISGVLVEAKTEGNKNLFMIVGIGINVCNPVPEMACSLQTEGVRDITPGDVLQRFQDHFEVSYREWITQSIV